MNDLINNEYFILVTDSIIYIALSFILFFIGKAVYGLFHPGIKVKHELVEKDNLAFALAHTGYFVGLVIAIGSAIVGPSNGIIQDIIDIAVYGVLAIILLNLSTIITDKIMLRHFSVRKEIIEDQNSGTGIIEAANAIASGLIIFGAVTGESGGLVYGIFTALLFWAIGQVVLIITGIAYNAITSYNIHEHIEKDNVAAGIGFAGAIIAIGNLLRFALSGNLETWTETLTEVGVETVIGLILLPIARLLADKILLPGQKLTDEIINQEKPNIGAGIVEAFAYIGSSILITWCL